MESREGLDKRYLASVWTIELCFRYCDIWKDFRIEIPAMQLSQIYQGVMYVRDSTVNPRI
jgi:hypothetical protein